VYKKNVPNGKFPQTQIFCQIWDILCNQGKLGVFGYVQDKTLFSKVNLCYQQGASYRPSLKWLAHKTFKLKLGYYIQLVTSMNGV
jgi:hypothetical protein